MHLINLSQIIRVIKSNQGMGLIKLSYDIQALHLVQDLITRYGVALNRNSIISKCYP